VKNSADEIISSAYDKIDLDISKIMVMVLTFFYGTGYLIQSITLRNYGVYRFEAVKLQYIEVGITFTVLLLLVTLMPVSLFHAHFRIRKKSNLPNKKIGAAGYLANTYNLLFLVLFLALFITQNEWNSVLNFPLGKYEINLNIAFSIYCAISIFVLIILPLVEREIVKKNVLVKPLFWIFVEPIRYSGVLAGILIDLSLFNTFTWFQVLTIKGLTFVLSAILLFGIASVIIFYMRKLGDKRSLHVLFAVGSTGLLLLLYICINAYVYSVVRHIPMNRGGKLPLSIAHLITKQEVFKTIPIHDINQTNKIISIGPVYVIDETNDYFYVAKEESGEWYKKWVTTFAIKKSEILYIRNERVTNGGPRSNQL